MSSLAFVCSCSGARVVQCINTGKNPFARIGDLITVAVKAVGQDRKVWVRLWGVLYCVAHLAWGLPPYRMSTALYALQWYSHHSCT